MTNKYLWQGKKYDIITIIPKSSNSTLISSYSLQASDHHSIVDTKDAKEDRRQEK